MTRGSHVPVIPVNRRFIEILPIASYIIFDPSGLHHNRQGFQSGPVPVTFTRLRSCIVPAEITEPPKISGGQNHKYDGR
jgi:hypothetical protein